MQPSVINFKKFDELLDYISNSNFEYILALGNFDSVHLGHQEVIKTSILNAKNSKSKSSVMILNPHPNQIFKKKNFKTIFSKETNIKLISNFQIDYIFILNFNLTFSKLAADKFVTKLINNPNIIGIVTGYNYHYGKNKNGNINSIYNAASSNTYNNSNNNSKKIIYKYLNSEIDKTNQKIQNKKKISLSFIPQIKYMGREISSSYIKSLLIFGDIQRTNRMLGDYYSISGIVTYGNKIASSLLDIPTANIELTANNRLVYPKVGVYFVSIIINKEIHFGVANIGYRPTLNSIKNQNNCIKQINSNNKEILTLEVHIFNFNQDLYQKNILVSFIDFIRDEKKFESLSALKKQIEDDLIICQRMLSDFKNNK